MRRLIRPCLALLGCMALGLVISAPVRADVKAYSITAGDANTPTSDRVIGWQFEALSPLSVTSLGYYAGGAASFNQNHTVSLFEKGFSTALCSLTLNAGNTSYISDGGFLFQSLRQSVELKTGVTYQILANMGGSGNTDEYLEGFKSGDDFGERKITMSSFVSLVPDATTNYSGLAGTSFSSYGASSKFDLYAGPNFQAAPVPELSSLSLLGSLLSMGGLALRRVRK